MDNGAQTKELIVKTTLELLQNVLPTNIMGNLEQLDAGGGGSSSNGDSTDFVNDADEDRFLYEKFWKQENQPMDQSTSEAAEGGGEGEASGSAAAGDELYEPQFVSVSEYNDYGEQVENNSSLTYYEIVEQEMMQSLPVTKDNLTTFSQILSDFPEISHMVCEFNFQSADQLTNILVYSLMSGESTDQIEQLMVLETGTVNHILEIMSEIIAQKKDAFIQWPNDEEIVQNVRDFQCYRVNEQYEFPSVFGALGTLDIAIQPSLPKFYSIAQPSCSSHSHIQPTYTPVKWQCSCDTNGFLQSSWVFIPTIERQSKNSFVFEINPVQVELENQKLDELYMVADETLAIFPVLLTPHEKRMIDADSFNKELHSKRSVIDRAFEKIQRRFPLIKRIKHRNPNSICNIIETIGILHNFFIIHRDDLYVDSE